MNSTPAASNARRMAMSLGAVIEVSFSASSARRMVATPTADSRARSSARQRRKARAALIWPLVKRRRFILTAEILYDMAYITRFGDDHAGHLPSRREHENAGVDPAIREASLFHWRLGRPNHHGQR